MSSFIRRFVPIFLILPFLLLCACNDVLVFDDLARAREAVNARNWPLAERLLDRVLRNDTDEGRRWEAWQQLLVVVDAASFSDRAILDYLEAMLSEFTGDDDRCKIILEKMAALYENQRSFSEASASWTSYLDLSNLPDSDRVNAYRHLASIQFKQRLFDAGEETLQQCLSLPLADRDKVMCMYDLADVGLARQHFDEVITLCHQILDNTDPDDDPEKVRSLAAFLLADASEALGRNDEALKIFEEWRDLYPNVAVMDNRIAHLRKAKKKQAKP